MSGSRNQATRFESAIGAAPPTFRCCLSCVHTSSLICSAVHSCARLPYTTPAACHSEMSTERIPRTVPSPICEKSMLVQNCRCETEVSAKESPGRSHDRLPTVHPERDRTGFHSSTGFPTCQDWRARGQPPLIHRLSERSSPLPEVPRFVVESHGGFAAMIAVGRFPMGLSIALSLSPLKHRAARIPPREDTRFGGQINGIRGLIRSEPRSVPIRRWCAGRSWSRCCFCGTPRFGERLLGRQRSP
jgi:hypothetical protein